MSPAADQIKVGVGGGTKKNGAMVGSNPQRRRCEG